MARQTDESAAPTLGDFERLIDELLTGSCRSHFQRWEIELLLDIEESVGMAQGPTKQVLRDYRAAVAESWAVEAPGPMKFSDYLARQLKRKAVQTAPSRRKERTA